METAPIQEPHLKERHSAFVRIWHWVLYLVMSGSLTTVLLAKVLFNTRSNTSIVQSTLQKNNVSVTDKAARAVSHEFNDKIWEWHTVLGYILAGLFVLRIIFEFFLPSEQKLIPLIKKAMKYLNQPGGDKKEARHYLLVKYAYIFFYISLAVQATTGIFMAYSDDIEKLQSARHLASNIHVIFMWIILLYIVLHIGGVILAELGKKYKGIVSNMIHKGE